MRQQGEPSVEDILDSIKRVMARDGKIAGVAPRAAPPHAGDRHAGHKPVAEDVLDLGADDRFYADEDGADEDGAAEEGADEPLLAEATRHSMRESLAALAMMSAPGNAPQIVRQGETSLEGMVRDLLRPALTQWLEAHLPTMVEELVAAEIARIVGKKA